MYFPLELSRRGQKRICNVASHLISHTWYRYGRWSIIVVELEERSPELGMELLLALKK